ncbi:unnamed protein product, partial [Prorocentrum cordatum]
VPQAGQLLRAQAGTVRGVAEQAELVAERPTQPRRRAGGLRVGAREPPGGPRVRA